MALDYSAIKSDNKLKYGTDIDRIGPMLLTNRYDNRIHFIYELLQNAEDALRRRNGWNGSRAVSFLLSNDMLRVSHFGKPFDEPDVRGICGIGEGTKEGLTDIGRFGIGFKSVYAFTGRPEIHSGDEDFAIETYVWPIAVPTVERKPDETVFVLPLCTSDAEAHAEIADGLRRLGLRTLLFLRHIEGIEWTIDRATSGWYLRDKPQDIGKGVRRVTLIGEEQGKPSMEETWLVFSREVGEKENKDALYVEIAFSITKTDKADQWSVQAISDSPLVVFFPTVVQTHLGFLMQGPYRTTPSRDNVPPKDKWNQSLISETATLLIEALRWMRDKDMLNVTALRSLPLEHTKFVVGTMFAPLFDTVKNALVMEPLLPRMGGKYSPAREAKLARTQELRELFNPTQLGSLFGIKGVLSWLSGDITQDRTPDLRLYLMNELGIEEITPATIIIKLNKAFLEAQTDGWIARLYEFLGGQPALLPQLVSLPLIRLEDGTHVTTRSNGHPQAFLPTEIETGFPTVRRAVCSSEEAWRFLESLGLTKPDPVDDVIRNVLRKYTAEKMSMTVDYKADIKRILMAFRTDSKAQREKLVEALRGSFFVMSVDLGDGKKYRTKPGDVYIATERLKELFAEIKGVYLVDDSYDCLHGEEVRELLEACGSTRYLKPTLVECDLPRQELLEIRRNAGLERSTSEYAIKDVTLSGLGSLLNLLPRLDVESRRLRAGLLWKALADVESRSGPRSFQTEYTWSYSHESKTVVFDSAVVRQLNSTAWVPDANGDLQQPKFIVFENLEWEPNPFLQSKIHFKPQIIETLAREAGFEPGVLDLLKKRGVTSVADLTALLGIEEEPQQPEGEAEPDKVDIDDALGKLLGDDAPEPTPPVPDPSGLDPSGRGGGSAASDGRIGQHTGARGGGGIKRTPGSQGGRPFISYVGTHPNDEEPDPEGLDQQARMALEEKAIALILESEPELRRTPIHNKGYDLFEAGPDGQPIRWVEVKAMTGDLKGRPATLTRAQFKCAGEHGEAYWLYVVEHAGTDSARIVRIQNPSGKARTFTFDYGWINVAELDIPSDVDNKQENPEE